jgi:hypothetical protein
MLSRPYPDEKPVRKSDGSWTYKYYQENLDPEARDREYTNVGLLKCICDDVPVGVLRQVARTPSCYEVLGTAFVGKWKKGYFVLEGPAA